MDIGTLMNVFFKRLSSNVLTRPEFFYKFMGGLLLVLYSVSFSTQAKEWQVEPGHGVLQKIIDLAKSGDVLRLSPGTYTGSIDIKKHYPCWETGKVLLTVKVHRM